MRLDIEKTEKVIGPINNFKDVRDFEFNLLKKRSISELNKKKKDLQKEYKRHRRQDIHIKIVELTKEIREKESSFYKSPWFIHNNKNDGYFRDAYIQLHGLKIRCPCGHTEERFFKDNIDFLGWGKRIGEGLHFEKSFDNFIFYDEKEEMYNPKSYQINNNKERISVRDFWLKYVLKDYIFIKDSIKSKKTLRNVMAVHRKDCNAQLERAGIKKERDKEEEEFKLMIELLKKYHHKRPSKTEIVLKELSLIPRVELSEHNLVLDETKSWKMKDFIEYKTNGDLTFESLVRICTKSFELEVNGYVFCVPLNKYINENEYYSLVRDLESNKAYTICIQDYLMNMINNIVYYEEEYDISGIRKIRNIYEVEESYKKEGMCYTRIHRVESLYDFYILLKNLKEIKCK